MVKTSEAFWNVVVKEMCMERNQPIPAGNFDPNNVIQIELMRNAAEYLVEANARFLHQLYLTGL